MNRHAKMRRFSKIMVGRFIGYLDRADSDGNNDTSILFIVTLFPEMVYLKVKMQNVLI